MKYKEESYTPLYVILREKMRISSYLDNSSTTKQYKSVTEVMVNSFENNFGNPSSLHQLGFENSKMLKTCKKNMSAYLQDTSTKVIFTGSGTEASNLAIRGISSTKKRNKGCLITSTIEHPATLETITSLASENFQGKILGVDQKGCININNLEELLNSGKTDLVSIMHVNNEVGTIQPIEEIGELINKTNLKKNKEERTVFHVDAIQSFKRIGIDIKNIDLISLSSHKIHGPKGVGALVVKDNIRLNPEISGGGQEYGLRSGTENIHSIIGFNKAIEEKVNLQLIKDFRDKLLYEISGTIKDIRVNSPEESSLINSPGLCAPHILNVSFIGTRAEVLLHLLEEDGIFVSTGSACSSNKKSGSHVLKAMGINESEIESAIRFSVGALNELTEIEYVMEKLKLHVDRLRKIKKR